jgi:hypothetical protein
VAYLNGLPWFRMYAAFMTDPDVEELSFEDQRHFVFLLCMKCSGLLDKDFDDPDKRERAIARRLGLQGEAFTFTKQRLMESRLIDGQWQPRSWQKLQFKSDHDAAERQRRSRANRDVTTASRDSHTPEQSRADTESEQKEASPPANPKPRPSKRVPQEFQVTEDLLSWARQSCPGVDVLAETENFRDHEFKDAHTDWPATWRKWMRRTAKDNPHGTSRKVHQPRLSAVERVRLANEKWLRDGDETGGPGVVIDG